VAKKPAQPEELKLPAIIGDTAKEKSKALVPAIKDHLHLLPEDLVGLMRSRFFPVKSNTPQMPMQGDQKALSTSWVKTINPLTQNKTFMGQQLLDGTILGKTVLFKPGPNSEPFPFIVMGAWEERMLGSWDSQKGSMNTRCQSRDGITPCQINAWGATVCEECPKHKNNRPKYNDDTESKTERCKMSINLIGIGGDFMDFYILQIKGGAIIDVFSKGFKKQLQEVASRGMPWYGLTFFLNAVQDGNFWGLQIANMLNTIPVPMNPDPDFANWKLHPDDPQNSAIATFAVLEELQTMAQMYIKERQQAARASYEKALASQSQISAQGGEGDDEETEVEGGGAEGLD